jgi:hypothetical protein
MSDRARPSKETRAAERKDAEATARADRMPTAEEERLADEQELDEDVAEHAEEMYERGAQQRGEGRIP